MKLVSLENLVKEMNPVKLVNWLSKSQVLKTGPLFQPFFWRKGYFAKTSDPTESLGAFYYCHLITVWVIMAKKEFSESVYYFR